MCCDTLLSIIVVSPVTEPVNGTTEQLVKNGHSVILKFVILEADPPVSADNITWYFTSISGRTVLPCTNHSTKYNFSSNCLTLTIDNVNASDGGLYEIFVSTRAGEDSSRIAVTIGEGLLHANNKRCCVVIIGL